jgi:ABC-type multidrug transport system permease subunit
MVTLHLLRPDYTLRRFLSEYAIGPFGVLVVAAAVMMAATFLMLLVGLRLSIHPSGFLTASCVLLGVVIISLCVCAVFPIDFMMQPDGSHPPLTSLSRASIIHIASSALLYVSLIALLLTLSSACKRDEKWRSFSHATLFSGFLILAFLVGIILVPFNWKGLVQRVIFLVMLIWLLLTGLRLRHAIPSAHGTAA